MPQPNHELRHLPGIQQVYHVQQSYRIQYHLVMYLCSEHVLCPLQLVCYRYLRLEFRIVNRYQ